MRKGDEGDCMYILFSGEVGIYVGDESEKCVAVLKDSKVFGERALETDDKRGATVMAHS
jgi:CRP-like cAMP-binding protein